MGWIGDSLQLSSETSSNTRTHARWHLFAIMRLPRPVDSNWENIRHHRVAAGGHRCELVLEGLQGGG